MRDRLDEFSTDAGVPVDVVVVTFAGSRTLAGYRRRFAEPLTVVSDEERELYKALGFGRGSVRRVYAWSVIRRYYELLRGGARWTRATDDTLQLGGNVVLDAEGAVRWIYPGAGPDDRPTVDELLSAVRPI